MRLLLILMFLLPPAPARCIGKLIEFGWDTPDTAYVRKHWREMEQLPFDGIVIKVFPEDKKKTDGRSLGWNVFQRRRFEPGDYEHAISDLRQARFLRFKDNFIQVVSQPGGIDWFDPEWSSVAHNAAVLAKIAKQGGCKGILFDPEQYSGYPVWGYRALPDDLKRQHTFSQYKEKVRERGREFIRAINREFPDLTILCLLGPSLTYIQSLQMPLENCEYSLLASFYDGICEAATPGTILVDGFEFSYSYRFHEAFKQAREYILEGARSISANPKEFSEHVRVGFGIWADHNSGKLGWHPDDLSKNYFSPAGLRASLHYALRETQGYVWVYSERFNWWEGTAPVEFIEALRLAKLGPGRGDIPRQPTPRAEEQPDYADDRTFPKLGTNLRSLMDLPRVGWKFRRDPQRMGTKQGWFRPELDDRSWRSISIGRFWEEEGEEYDGTAWYRLRFRVPEHLLCGLSTDNRTSGRGIPSKHRIYFAFGAVDEVTAVWLNGKFVGSHDMYDVGWNVPFMLDVTGKLRFGEENVLAVRVFDLFGGGGIWKSVKLMIRVEGDLQSTGTARH